MELSIGGKNFTLEFGLEFIATLDTMYTQKAEGMEFGLGVESAIPYLKMKNPTVLVNLIKAGTSHLNTSPSNKGINEFLTEKANNDTLDKFFGEIEEGMRVAPFLKGKMADIDKNVAAQEKKIKKVN